MLRRRYPWGKYGSPRCKVQWLYVPFTVYIQGGFYNWNPRKLSKSRIPCNLAQNFSVYEGILYVKNLGGSQLQNQPCSTSLITIQCTDDSVHFPAYKAGLSQGGAGAELSGAGKCHHNCRSSCSDVLKSIYQKTVIWCSSLLEIVIFFPLKRNLSLI